ncbi:MAG: autoinducer binding domain-containing protein [Pseudomonadota bacterium]
MAKDLETTIDQLKRVNSLEDLYGFVLGLGSFFETDHIIYHSIQHSRAPFALASYGSEWSNYYEGNRLYLVDPVVLSSFQRFHPYEWKQLDWSGKSSRALMVDATDGGVGSQGFSVPIRGPHGETALFSINHNATDAVWEKKIDKGLNEILLVSHYVHEAARLVINAPINEDVPSLSPREIDALTYLALGQNRARIAEKLKISEHTLRVYIESSRLKLAATNTTQAVAKAITNGLISI